MLVKPLCHTRTGEPVGRLRESVADGSASNSKEAVRPFEATAHDLRNLGE
ncbi:hypothetical protein C485_01765 [Natrinema altunense JCM 12890]|uniref:Uncharacterized protein n=1 Tax=Natrinema altunense (strain JCM 12890 / CGMCC 1.3731 / AJ2) TaxID=1227494 RepID=M0A111_NATA2|nr:hypothetical protein C485_01765 [Natrinema altunense JCM 12890]